jgi:hypothetical protein
MGDRALSHANFARLNDQGVPVLCSRKEASEWYAGRAALCAFKHSRIGNYDIWTAFRWFSLEPDTPLFWEVSLFDAKQGTGVGYRFGTKEAALAFHSNLVNGEEPLEQVETDEHDLDPADWWKECDQ